MFHRYFIFSMKKIVHSDICFPFYGCGFHYTQQLGKNIFLSIAAYVKHSKQKYVCIYISINNGVREFASVCVIMK